MATNQPLPNVIPNIQPTVTVAGVNVSNGTIPVNPLTILDAMLKPTQGHTDTGVTHDGDVGRIS